MKSFTPKIAFAGGAVDYAEDKRDEATLSAYLNDRNARALLMNEGKPSIRQDGSLLTVHPSELLGKNVALPGPIFLGLDKIGPVFAFSLDGGQGLTNEESFQEVRFVASRLDARSLALIGRAKSLFDWHVSHRFCSNCGQESRSVGGGIHRKCDSCQADHFPRVNPVAIMLVLNGEDCLLGRSPGWPDGGYSALAGFIAPGETLEEGCKREVKEEVGLDVHSVQYLFSQPWPFPSQLMMGLICQTQDRTLTLNKTEIEDAIWVSKSDVRGVFEGSKNTFLRPPSFTIANQLLRHWVYSESS